MSDRLLDWALNQIQVYRSHKVAAIVLIALGAVIGWQVAAFFYAERIAILQEKAGLLQGDGADEDRAIRAVLISQLMNTPDVLFTTLNGGGLLDFAKDYDVMIVCGPSVSLADKFRETRIAVSEPLTIVNGSIAANISLKGSPLGAALADLGAAAYNDFKKANPDVTLPPASIIGQAQVWREPVLVPKGTRTGDIRSLSDVRRIGGKVMSADVPVRIAEDPRKP